jgi:hypothetical protein
VAKPPVVGQRNDGWQTPYYGLANDACSHQVSTEQVNDVGLPRIDFVIDGQCGQRIVVLDSKSIGSGGDVVEGKKPDVNPIFKSVAN